MVDLFNEDINGFGIGRVLDFKESGRRVFEFDVILGKLISLNRMMGGKYRANVKNRMIKSGFLDGITFNGVVEIESMAFLGVGKCKISSTNKSGFIVQSKLDIINYAGVIKAIEDAMVNMGVLRNDTQEFVKSHKISESVRIAEHKDKPRKAIPSVIRVRVIETLIND